MLVQIIQTYNTESVLNVQSSRTCNNTDKNNHVYVTYIGISTRITYEQNIRTRAKQYWKHFIHTFQNIIYIISIPK
jgi:hypothetical protein